MDYLENVPRKTNPKQNANFLSNIFFLYTIKLFRKGNKTELQENDLYETLPSMRSEKLGDRAEDKWKKRKTEDKSVFWLMWKCYGKRYILFGICKLLFDTPVMILKPIALGKLVSYFSPGQTDISKLEASFYAIVVVGLHFVHRTFVLNYFLALYKLEIQTRTAFCSFMYRKILKMTPQQLQKISIGKIVTLITRDVDSLELFVDYANEFWIGLVKVLVMTYVMYKRIGMAALVGVSFFLLVTPLLVYAGFLTRKLRQRLCEKSDGRLKTIQETLSAIKIIKMYGWEKFFDSKITEYRKKEIKTLHQMYILRYLVLALSSLAKHLSFYAILMSYIWFGNGLTAEMVYFVTSSFQTISHMMSNLLPEAIYQAAELTASGKRIEEVIKAAESPEVVQSKTQPMILLKNVSVSINDKEVLNIDKEFHVGLNVVYGSVGSGKSMLLKTLMQEYEPAHGGFVIIKGRISYASQEPWVFPSTIKQNILFGEEYDEKRYQEVLKVCALVFDLELLEHGDATIIEDKGINLSKGQRARINLARAVYRNVEIYLLDDVLATLDAHVSDFIFEECIKKFLEAKLVVFVTNKQSLNVKEITILNGGTTKTEQITNWVKQNGEVQNIIKVKEEKEEKGEQDKLIETEQFITRKVYHETKKEGVVDSTVYKRYFKFGGGYFVFLGVVCAFILAQFVESYVDKLVADWVNMEEEYANYTKSGIDKSDELFAKRLNVTYIFTAMNVATSVTVIIRVLMLFFFARKASIRIHKHMTKTIINATMHFFDTNFIGNILNRFSKDMMVLDEFIPFILYYFLQMRRCFAELPHILGDIGVNRVKIGSFILTSPQYFFNISSTAPRMSLKLQEFISIFGIAYLMASVNASFIIPSVILFGILYYLRRYYLKTGRSLMRLESAVRSPMIGYLNSTLEGLPTIRALKKEAILRYEYDRHQDLYISASYSIPTYRLGYTFFMDCCSSIFTASVISTFLIFKDGTKAGSVGLALSQAMKLAENLQWGIKMWAEIENRMCNVERVLEYTVIKQENRTGTAPEILSSAGVVFENVSLTYPDTTEKVLKNIDFVAKPSEKIGIVGRTGSGKSSIISVLFKLYEIEGRILLDGIDIKTLSLDYLRSKISIIPQDPVLFTGDIRSNIDPTGNHTDEEIWSAIETANLKKMIDSLEFKIGEDTLSVGQRQLVCIARAIIRKNNVIILDEATANMDLATDKLVHDTIDRCFSSCTVFVIAHRLRSVMDSDKIIVLDKGEIIEVGSPEDLVKKNGVFFNMVQKSGL